MKRPEALGAELEKIVTRTKHADESTRLTLVTQLFERVADMEAFKLRGETSIRTKF